jgi:hypothetical protein
MRNHQKCSTTLGPVNLTTNKNRWLLMRNPLNSKHRMKSWENHKQHFKDKNRCNSIYWSSESELVRIPTKRTTHLTGYFNTLKSNKTRSTLKSKAPQPISKRQKKSKRNLWSTWTKRSCKKTNQTYLWTTSVK